MGDAKIMQAEEYGSYAIVKENYKTEEEFWKAISDAVRVHTDNDQDVWVRYEDVGIYIITYACAEEYGGPHIALVTEDWDSEPLVEGGADFENDTPYPEESHGN